MIQTKFFIQSLDQQALTVPCEDNLQNPFPCCSNFPILLMNNHVATFNFFNIFKLKPIFVYIFVVFFSVFFTTFYSRIFFKKHRSNTFNTSEMHKKNSLLLSTLLTNNCNINCLEETILDQLKYKFILYIFFNFLESQKKNLTNSERYIYDCKKIN